MQTLLPVTFIYSLKLKEKLRGSLYETIEEMKEAVMKVIDMLTQEDPTWGLPEVVGTVQQVHCKKMGARVSCDYYQ